MARHALLAFLAWPLSALAVLDANQAPADDLASLKGLGPKTSQRIVDTRQSAPFRSWQDFIQRVPGIGPAMATKLSSQGLRIHGKSFEPDAQASASGSAAITEYRPMVPKPLEPTPRR